MSRFLAFASLLAGSIVPAFGIAYTLTVVHAYGRWSAGHFAMLAVPLVLEALVVFAVTAGWRGRARLAKRAALIAVLSQVLMIVLIVAVVSESAGRFH